MTETPDLFGPVKLGALTLPNRIVMAPMTRSRAPGNLPNALMAEYYAQRASAGLIITEGTTPAANGRGYSDIPGLYSPAQVEGWRGVADAVHAKGGRIFAQLMHVGRIALTENQDGEAPVAPSAIAAKGQMYTPSGMKPLALPRALEEAEIESLIEAFAQAARNAVAAGLDGIEIHGANGYLPGQFLAPNANKRTDRWGGSAENRARFLIAITDAAAKAIGPDRVGVRLSPGNPFNDIDDPDVEGTYTPVIQGISGKGLAYVHFLDAKPAFDVIGLARKHFGGPIILNAGYDKARAQADIASGRADLIAFGSSYIANPDLVERLKQDAPLNPPDQASFYGGDAKGYTDYPALAA
ncbi:alkene reductase [Falsiroseomonas sp.]|uniref:alkene reductase n=1 Tax=Falsiroseomonas sp. TaxID=2870721 RepID=UPI00271FE021|nr:alkene reductase [Falsiroseomonas sp.]MDO9502060.1 alkene reductase [Falsiroseomonas sp.]